eukprot:CAMPEP_0201519588 /NCGR_PEP_ID=MMETSP0161_2-20130828/10103_1 /ASSEMBLY_ACC=CAM_ASM_000251 /TAXON_ID=180227 /ORGANISM="Neoparamoeba aestuarina, Strain SoJaBio B1-5/56/2" /LENGTH=216 /DNA_ID=CAMNT_0047917673 /DNA_START=15 /DNA_END=662 /DNA_ORIENTATION=+
MNRIAKSLGLNLQCDMLERLSSEMVLSIKSTLKAQGPDADCFEKVLKNKEGTTRHIHLLLRDINTEFQRQQGGNKMEDHILPFSKKKGPNARPVSMVFPQKSLPDHKPAGRLMRSETVTVTSEPLPPKPVSKSPPPTSLPSKSPPPRAALGTTKGGRLRRYSQLQQQQQPQYKQQQRQNISVSPLANPQVMIGEEEEKSARKILMWYRSQCRRNLW